MDPGSVSARRNIQIPEENRFSYRDKSSLQLHRDRNILRSRKINSALPIPCNPQEFISLFLRAHPHIHTHPRYFSNTSASLTLSFVRSLFLPACRKYGACLVVSAYLSHPSRPSPEDRFSFQSVVTRLFVIFLRPAHDSLYPADVTRGSSGHVSYL